MSRILILACLLNLGACINLSGIGRFLSKAFSGDNNSSPEGRSGSHGEKDGGGAFKGLGARGLSGLNYQAAVNFATNLPRKGEYARAIANGNPLCAKGVRQIINTLFGYPLDSSYNDPKSKACAIGLTQLNGKANPRGYRYRSIAVRAHPPEGSVIICSRTSNPSCGSGSAGHAEMFIGGRYRSGANDSAGSLCMGSSRYTNVRVYALEKM